MLKIVWGGTGILHAISRRFAIIEEFCKSYLANALIIISEERNKYNTSQRSIATKLYLYAT